MTYQDLLDSLQNLTPLQLKQNVMILHTESDGDKIVGLLPVYCMDSIEQLCHNTETGEVITKTYSSDDHTHHPEQFVLLADYHPFSEDGDSYYMIVDSGLQGNKSGKIVE